MLNTIAYFQHYNAEQAPFMHNQFREWTSSKPLAGYKVIHNVPVVPNTLLKIACLIAAGADVIVTNPNFLIAHSAAVYALQSDGINYAANIADLKGIEADIYFDCGAELFQKLGPPKIGAIELTASGDTYYRQCKTNFPVISIDPTYTKQLETLFGSAASANVAIKQLTGQEVAQKNWLIFGFGKIGRGLAYYCVNNHAPVVVVDIDANAREAARTLEIAAIDPNNFAELQHAVSQADIIVTASGNEAILNKYPKEWFKEKILANMGVLDEYGDQFDQQEVLNKKLPINFILNDPTPMRYMDPEFYAHNIAALTLIQRNLSPGVTVLNSDIDQDIIETWCTYHNITREKISPWFVNLM